MNIQSNLFYSKRTSARLGNIEKKIKHYGEVKMIKNETEELAEVQAEELQNSRWPYK